MDNDPRNTEAQFQQIYGPFLKDMNAGNLASVEEGFRQDFSYILRLTAQVRRVQLLVRQALRAGKAERNRILQIIEQEITANFPEMDEQHRPLALARFLKEAQENGWIIWDTGRYKLTPEGFKAIKDKAGKSAETLELLRAFKAEAEAGE